MRGLQGKGVLVTGGASGIGAATVSRFLEEGSKVCVLDRDPGGNQAIQKKHPALSGALAADVSRLSGRGEVFSFRGYYLPIVRLYEIFGVEPRTKVLDEGLVVVAEGEGHQRIGLFVDDLLGQQQVVIKSLEANYGHVEGVSGATILGDGSVALILDIPGLIRAMSMRAAA